MKSQNTTPASKILTFPHLTKNKSNKNQSAKQKITLSKPNTLPNQRKMHKNHTLKKKGQNKQNHNKTIKQHNIPEKAFEEQEKVTFAQLSCKIYTRNRYMV